MENKSYHLNVLVAGLGKTGQSLLDYYLSLGIHAAGYDEHLNENQRATLAQRYPHSMFYSGTLQHALQQDDFNTLALSPGLSAYRPEVENFQRRGKNVTGDIDILCQLIHGRRDKIIAITGSNGKSTVTELVGHLCRAAGLDTVVAGNIGLPVLQAYAERGGQPADVWVLELSSFQLETIKNLGARAATCLNISEDHLDRYTNLLDYAHTKDRIFRQCDHQILNLDDDLCRLMAHRDSSTRWFSTRQKADWWLKTTETASFLMAGDELLIATENLPLQGRHHMANILAALALCESIGIPRQKLINALPSFKGLPHRTEKIDIINDVLFIDDSKGTNVGATIAAIEGIDAPIILIAGGLGKDQDFHLLAKAAQGRVKQLCLIGQDAAQIADAFATTTIHQLHCSSLEEAVNEAYLSAVPGDVVLLSPACASMDMFRDYAHRASVFIDAVKRLKR